MLDGEGIVFFDPYVLADFIKEKDISTSNLFQLFNQDSLTGDEVIKQGIILPIYTIPPIDYQIVINTENSVIKSEWLEFSASPFPLVIGENKKIVAADISSIMDWDAEFYQKLAMDGPKAPQAATSVPAGKYSVVINGYSEREYTGRGPKNIGYELLLNPVAVLPIIAQDVDIESFNFALWKPGRPSPLT